MFKTSLNNYATRKLYEKEVDANWYDKPTSTEASSFLHISSDIITSTYEFLLENDNTNLLKALKIIKHSPHIIFGGRITGDEYTYVPEYDLQFKMSIGFSKDKTDIEIKLYIKNTIDKKVSLRNMPCTERNKLNKLLDSIKEIEKNYKSL